MSWVCSVCSANNDDEAELCFVCDAPRPAASPPSPAPAPAAGVHTLTKNRVLALGLRGDVWVPEEFNAIGEAAFAGRTDISSVTLHGAVKKIGPSAFSGCHALTRVVGGEGLTSIGARAFYDCPALLRPHPTARYVADDAFAMPTARPAPPPPPPRVTPTPRPAPPRVASAPSRTTTAPSRPSGRGERAASLGVVLLFLTLCATVLFFVLAGVRFVNAAPLSGCLWLGAALAFSLFLVNGSVLATTEAGILIPHIFLLPLSAVNLLLLSVIGEGYALIGTLFAGAYMLLSVILFIYSIYDYYDSDCLYVKDRLTLGLEALLSALLFVLFFLLI